MHHFTGWLRTQTVVECYFKGVHSIQRAIINLKDQDDHRGKKGDKEMLVEGYGLQKVMTTEGHLLCHFCPEFGLLITGHRNCW